MISASDLTMTSDFCKNRDDGPRSGASAQVLSIAGHATCVTKATGWLVTSAHDVPELRSRSSSWYRGRLSVGMRVAVEAGSGQAAARSAVDAGCWGGRGGEDTCAAEWRSSLFMTVTTGGRTHGRFGAAAHSSTGAAASVADVL